MYILLRHIRRSLPLFLSLIIVKDVFAERIAGNVNQKSSSSGMDKGLKILKDTDDIVETFLLKEIPEVQAARDMLKSIRKKAEKKCKAGSAGPEIAGAATTAKEDAERTCLSYATHYYLSTMALSEPINGATESTYPHLPGNFKILNGGVAGAYDTKTCPGGKTMQSFAMDFRTCDNATGKINGPTARADSRNNLKCEFEMLCVIRADNTIVSTTESSISELGQNDSTQNQQIPVAVPLKEISPPNPVVAEPVVYTSPEPITGYVDAAFGESSTPTSTTTPFVDAAFGDFSPASTSETSFVDAAFGG